MTIAREILERLKIKNQTRVYNLEDYANGHEFHYDWYFPNHYPNRSVGSDKFNPRRQILNGINYHPDLVKELLLNDEYRQNYLQLTGKYFNAIGIDLQSDDRVADVDYDLASVHIIRLKKIIESYQILMAYSHEIIDQKKGRGDDKIISFFNLLKKNYDKIYRSFAINQTRYKQSMGVSEINNFDDCFRNKRQGSNAELNNEVIRNLNSQHCLIHAWVDSELSAPASAGPRPPPLAPAPRPAPPYPPLLPPARARPDPLLAGSSSKKTLMRIKTVGDEIGESGRVTQNAEVTSTGRVAIPATIIKPIVSSQLYGVENFWASHERPSDQYRRGNDYLVLKKNIGDLDYDQYTQAIEKAMAEVISNCQKHLDMTKDEVMQAITLAKKYGGLGNVAEEALLCDPLLTDVAGVENRKAMLNKFCQFSFLVQKSNKRNRIYSGRKGGKLVGLRLTFVSEKAISLWQKNSRAIEARGGGAGGTGGAGRGGGAGGGSRR